MRAVRVEKRVGIAAAFFPHSCPYTFKGPAEGASCTRASEGITLSFTRQNSPEAHLGTDIIDLGVAVSISHEEN